MRTTTLWIGAAAFGATAWNAPAQETSAQETPQLLSYEAIPSAQVELDLDAADYAEREALTQAALERLVPGVVEAVGLDPAAIETEVTPGGYLLNTNASLQSRAPLTDEEATRLAAALGYVFRQWSILVSQLDDAGGATGFVTVAFPQDALTPELAQAFFEHAAEEAEGLGGGYTAFGDEMIFLNVVDEAGAPYSGLDDMEFAARLGRAAGEWDGPEARVVDAGHAEARFVDNDWERAPEGEDYVEALDDPDLLARLDALRAEHTGLVEEMAAEYGWR